jgi:cobalt-zinc-cadmium efflux system outer membrane protein
MMVSSGRRAFARAACTASAVALVLIPGVAESAGAPTLSLDQALIMARDADAGLPAADARVEAAEAGVRQAGIRPQAVVGADVENFAATGSHGFVERTESTVYYQQTLERGDKRMARTDAARAELELARLRRAVRALDLFRQVETAWAEALAAEATVQLAREQLQAAEALRTEVNRRVQAARDPLFAGARADTQVAQAQIALSQAQIAAENARAALAAYWGGPAPQQLDPAALERLADLPIAAPARSADLALLEAERDAAAARIRVEQARTVPDVTLRGGVRMFGLADEVALVAGGSMPLGSYAANRANIERAEAERLAAEREIAAARAVRDREVMRLRARLAANETELRRIDAEILPRAEETVRLVREGFARGGFSPLDVIEAQRALLDARARRIEVLRQFHSDRASLDRLIDRFAHLVPAEARP